MTGIHPALAHLAQPVDELAEMDDNPRRGSLPAIKKSLTQFGQVEPLLVTTGPTGVATVVHGNHRLRAMRELGWPDAAVLDVTGYSDEEVKALSLAMNRVADLGTYDTGDLLALINQIDNQALLEPAGYDKTTLEMLELVESRQHEFDREAAERREEKKSSDGSRLSFNLPETTMDVWRSMPWDPDLSESDRFLAMLNCYAQHCV